MRDATEPVITDTPAADIGEPAVDDVTLLGGDNTSIEGDNPPPEGDANNPTEPELPEKYELSMQEGFVLDETAMAEFEPLLKEAKVSKETAQKFADLHMKQMIAAREADKAMYADEVKRWVSELKADPEIGGAKLNENLAYGANVIKKYGSDDVKRVLNETGLGSHPAIVKMLVKVGRAISEDTFVDGSTTNKEVSREREINSTAALLFDKSLGK